MTMSDRVALMDAGCILQCGTPSELYARPATLTVARFIGTPTINVLPGRSDHAGRLILGGRPLPLTLPSYRHRPVSIGIRPEALTPLALRQVLPSSALSGVVRRNEFHGAEWIATIALDEPELGSIVCRMPAEDPDAARLAEGIRVAVPVALDKLHLFDDSGMRLEPARQTSVTGRLGMPQRMQA